jgi:2-dehydro-3-deoxyphosphogluconate aldolase / (4S)-4-hydroxy-2-oxoglutarate aldolase
MPTTSFPSVVVIYRGLGTTDVLAATEHLVAAGLSAFEVTVGSPDVFGSIAALADRFGDVAGIGAGTVRSVAEVRRAEDAGASFIISPDTRPDVIALTKDLGLVSIPGAFTPTEIASACDHGADIVKLFPAAVLPPAFVRLVREPLPQAQLMVTGGVSAEAARDFLAAGACSVGVGAGLFDRDAVAARDWARMTLGALAYVNTALRTEEDARDRG